MRYWPVPSMCRHPSSSQNLPEFSAEVSHIQGAREARIGTCDEEFFGVFGKRQDCHHDDRDLPEQRIPLHLLTEL